jgi:hypothetical protein
MAKFTKKRARTTTLDEKAKKSKKTAKSPTKATKYVNCLMGLHNLQANLLEKLRKELL